MDKWGNHMMEAQFVVAEMAAIGFKLRADAFTSRMRCGPHLLAPTGSDLSGKYGEDKQCLAADRQTDRWTDGQRGKQMRDISTCWQTYSDRWTDR